MYESPGYTHWTTTEWPGTAEPPFPHRDTSDWTQQCNTLPKRNRQLRITQSYRDMTASLDICVQITIIRLCAIVGLDCTFANCFASLCLADRVLCPKWPYSCLNAALLLPPFLSIKFGVPSACAGQWPIAAGPCEWSNWGKLPWLVMCPKYGL